MPSMVFAISLISLCYALAAFFRFMEKVRGTPTLGWHGTVSAFIGLATHSAVLLHLLSASSPYTRFPPSLVILVAALTLVISCLFLEWKTRETYFSLFVLPLAIPLVTLAQFRTGILNGPEFSGPWFFLHILGSIAGECFFFLAALAAATYLYLVRNLKQKNRNRALFIFPSLSRLDSLIATFSGIGLTLFFIGLFSGSIWSWDRYGILEFGHPKKWGALAIFLLVGTLYGARAWSGWAGPRWAWACLISFGLSLLLIFGIDGNLHWRP